MRSIHSVVGSWARTTSSYQRRIWLRSASHAWLHSSSDLFSRCSPSRSPPDSLPGVINGSAERLLARQPSEARH